ncbi:aldehyde dehydrogenase family protein [Bacillus sp. M6-12]|uniref:alpha-ketoglutaric semialdehyde dehydrogenase GucD n=1 Tax=Bacillus sp. M6-12 TaxID=2054166 RepID=UPI000C75DBD8|nr:alpha-ketoglutaric semialdehyde dehydrogenase GucD [Bacillus sp. M6-12]PLS16133.1 aldehyde dehydrogenase family protein [Bacillus sp. M6-12]
MVSTLIKTYKNFINGEWKNATTEHVEASINPADKFDIIGYVQKSSIVDLEQATYSAKEAHKQWKKLSAPVRGEYLYKVASQLEKNADDIAEVMTREMGKTLSEAKGETLRGVAILRYFAGEGMRSIGDVIPSTDNEALMFTTRVPIGVVGVITPWNFPVAIPLWKIAPALVYGNTVVFKPAQETAVTATKVIQCFEEAGLPKGVINMVTGSGAIIGQGIVEHPYINGITFTGSDEVGKLVGEGALARGAKYQLEMGGKNPVIVAEDADLDLAVEATISGGLRSTGQKCTATSRVLVHSGIYDEFKQKLLNKIKELKVGNGLNSDTWMGPCASENQLNSVLSFIQKGIQEGAKILHGGKQCDAEELRNGFFVEPTVFDNVKSNMKIAQEEIFGPVLALIKVDSLEDALDIANDVKYGLSASIFTTNISNILSFINEVDAGLLRINSESAGVELQAPFGGMKLSSSHSREQGQAAKEFFTAIKTIFIKR